MWKWLRRSETPEQDIARVGVSLAERQTDAVPGQAGEVPGENTKLHSYLTNRYADIVVLTFDQIEVMLGVRLPDAARTQPEWWTARRTENEPACAGAWILAGMTASPNLLAQTVVFACVSS